MFRNKIYFLITVAFIFLIVGIRQVQAACQATVEVVVRGANGSLLTGAKFSVLEQLVNANGERAAGKSVGAGTTDKATGSAKLTLNLTEGVNTYLLKVANPTFTGYDFWFFDQLILKCEDNLKTEVSLGGLKLRVMDQVPTLQKNIAFTLYQQTFDNYGQPALGKQIGAGNTGANGEFTFYLPTSSRSQGLSSNYYVLEIKSAKGQKFYLYNLESNEFFIKDLEYRLSDLVITATDTKSGSLLPGAIITVHERLNRATGGYEPGKVLVSLKTDNQGQAYLQYPAGNYILQYTANNGQKISFPYVEILNQKRNTYNLGLENYTAPAKCTIKSNLNLVFRDYDNKIIGGLAYNIYEQKTDNDGLPVVGNRLARGQVSAGGLASLDFYPEPQQFYLLEVCDKVKLGCFWFVDISFQCLENLTLTKTLSSVEFVFRDSHGGLLPKQKFSLYKRVINADGQAIVDKSQVVGDYITPASGRLRLYLDSHALNGEELPYLVAVTNKKNTLFAEWQIKDGTNQTLTYIISDNGLRLYEKPVPKSAVGKLAGRILLQVEDKGQAWYVNPATNKRHYLGRPADAFALMRRLAIGISNNDLRQIPISLDNSAGGIDADGDGLSDNLEKALGTNPALVDSDQDGYADSQEAETGFNPTGEGKLPLNDSLAAKQAGRILLQVEGAGEAWYVNPLNKRRYYLGRPEDAFALMRALGLGITNANLEGIGLGD